MCEGRDGEAGASANSPQPYQGEPSETMCDNTFACLVACLKKTSHMIYTSYIKYIYGYL